MKHKDEKEKGQFKSGKTRKKRQTRTSNTWRERRRTISRKIKTRTTSSPKEEKGQ